jgi:ribosomal protein S18 acetylase RimI-like enzyme
MTDVVYNTVTKKDNQIKAFERREWKIADMEHYGYVPDLRKQRFSVVAKHENGDIVGLAEMEMQGSTAYLKNLLVGKAYQRQGVGKKLMDLVVEEVKARGGDKIWTETDASWAAAQFYKNLGFVVSGEHQNHCYSDRVLIFTMSL